MTLLSPGAGRRHLLDVAAATVVASSLVLIIGDLGLVAGHAAGQQARKVHRDDRLRLQ